MKTALTLGFGTILWPYAKFGFSAPLAALCITAGTYGVWAGMRLARPSMLFLGGAGLGCAVLVRHELILVCAPVALWMAAESNWKWSDTIRRGLMAGSPVVVAILITLVYNDMRFGNPIDTGYLRDVTVKGGSFLVGLYRVHSQPRRIALHLFAGPVGGLRRACRHVSVTIAERQRSSRARCWC